jgi:hypothetical protein
MHAFVAGNVGWSFTGLAIRENLEYVGIVEFGSTVCLTSGTAAGTRYTSGFSPIQVG